MLKPSTRRLPLHLLAVATLLLTGCSLAPTYQQPASPLPEKWNAYESSANVDAISLAAMLEWRMFVGDARLRGLIEQGLANNRDLRQTILNVEAARAQYRVERADRLPTLDLQTGGTRQRTPASLGVADQPQVHSTWQAGLGMAAYELDLFGRITSLSKSGFQEYLATESAARAARISLVAELIQAYVTRHGAQQRRLLTEDALRSREASLKLIAERRAHGIGSALDYQEALGLAEQARAELERTERDIRQASNALGLLVGNSSIADSLPTTPDDGTLLVQEIKPGLPSELLARRPDIHAAEYRLRARNADIGAARAAFFPRITLTGTLGSSSTELSGLFESGQRAWSFAPQISLPIFDGGRTRANLDLAQVRKDIAIAEYERIIQTAFREASDALAATDTLRREELALTGLVQSGREAVRLSEARYRAGVDSHLRYLDAQRNAYASEIALIEVSTQRRIALAALFRALGGGWGEPATPSDVALVSSVARAGKQ